MELDSLEKQAGAGDVWAQLALARLMEERGQTMAARGWYAHAAKRGNAAALHGLAASLLTHHPTEVDNGMRFMRAAAEQGDADALHVCAALAAQDTALADNWNVALDFLTAAAERGSPLARGQLALLGGLPAADAETDQDWKSLRGHIDITRWLKFTPRQTISQSPQIFALEKFAAPEICDWLIKRAWSRITRARVYDPATGDATIENHRTNGSANFELIHWDLPLVLLRTRIAHEVGLPPHCLEHPLVLHYAPGQEFEPHYDFLDPELPGLRREIMTKGQRVATFLVYLNDDFEGAETEFLDLGIRHRGKKGDALLFWNLDTNGNPDRRTRHAGRPPQSGEKWVLSQWIREATRSPRAPFAVHQG
ncbi:MAG TPA: 2OG-Fe(II) oxygenase [Rhizomicrobium sp.]|jgi:prolyl 4-hydroxylase